MWMWMWYIAQILHHSMHRQFCHWAFNKYKLHSYKNYKYEHKYFQAKIMSSRKSHSLLIDPFAFFKFHTLIISGMTCRKSVIDSEYIKLKSVFLLPLQLLMSLYSGQWFSLWSSSSILLHLLQSWLIVPLKLFPHSSIPYLANIIVFASLLLA